MKPPYLKKLSLKDLRKAYTHQWRLNIQVVTENSQLWDIIQNLKQLLAHEQKKRTEAELLNVDLEEALSRSRQLRKSLQEVADRKTWEKAKIEDMARNLFEVIRAEVEPVAKEVFWEGCYKDRDWSKLSEEEKDRFRVHATYIISHQPTDGKPEGTTLDEGSAG